MKIADLPPEEQKKVRGRNNERKRRQRDREKAEKLAAQPIPSHGYEMPEGLQEQIAAYRKSTLESIKAELGDLTAEDEFVIYLISSVYFGFDKGIIQSVYDPVGLLVGGVFPESAARQAVIHAHRTQILDSPTFKTLYYSVLKEVSRRAKKDDFWDANYVDDIRCELNGTFRLPVEPAPVVEPQAPVEPLPKVPSDAEIREAGRLQFLRQLRLDVPDGASRYLEG